MENDLVPLSILALELPETADELAARFADSVIIADALGRRCVAASVARQLVEAEAQRKHDVAESARRLRVEMAERRRRRERPVPVGVDREVPDGMSPALAMCAQDGPPRYEGGAYTHRLTAGDWHFGNAEGGASIGPTRSEMARQARERAAERKRRKGGTR